MLPGRFGIGRSKGLLLGLILVFAMLDQASKSLAKALLVVGEPLPVLLPWFQLTLAYNTGAAFSMLRHRPLLLTAMTSLIFLALLVYALSRRRFRRGEGLAWALVLGGALGNLIDRVRFGQVTDFLDVAVIRYPVFNVADSLIFCGVLLLIVIHWRALPVSPDPAFTDASPAAARPDTQGPAP